MRYRLAAFCPACGVPPVCYAYAAQIDAVEDLPPETLLHSYVCHVLYCETRYDLTARAYHEAPTTDESEPPQPPPVADRRKFREHIAKQVWREIQRTRALNDRRFEVRGHVDSLRLEVAGETVAAVERPDWWKPGDAQTVKRLARELIG